MNKRNWIAAVLAASLLPFGTAFAQEAQIRKALAERLPQLTKIDEITRTPMPGLWEVRFNGTEIIYTDDKGDFILVNGSLIDTKTRTDLTEARQEKLLAVDWSKLPLKDAIVYRQGNGSRKLAVFEDPNCGYCKRFERELAELKDVTLYVVLLPILGPDSLSKSRDIWCAADRPQAWRDYMLRGVLPSKAPAKCDTSALDRNSAFARQYRINGTPAVFFEDGSRKPGALPGAEVERLLVAATAAAKKN